MKVMMINGNRFEFEDKQYIEFKKGRREDRICDLFFILIFPLTIILTLSYKLITRQIK